MSKQANALLIALEAGDYAGGGTRFWGRFHKPFLVRPDRGGGVTFSPDVEHQGAKVSRGRRRVVFVTTKECTETGDELESIQAAQKRGLRPDRGVDGLETRVEPDFRAVPTRRR